MSGKKKLYCNTCRHHTNHILQGQHTHRWAGSYDPDFQGEDDYNLWACAGCDTGLLEIVESDSESYQNDGEPEYRYRYFPKRLHESLEPKNSRRLRSQLERIYGETIECFNDGSLILATAGLRALLEGVCEDKRISGRDLKRRIDGLRTLLPNDNIIRALHHFRFTGNDAVHNLRAPRSENVKAAIDVMEDLLNFLYEMEYKVARLARSDTDSDE